MRSGDAGRELPPGGITEVVLQQLPVSPSLRGIVWGFTIVGLNHLVLVIVATIVALTTPVLGALITHR